MIAVCAFSVFHLLEWVQAEIVLPAVIHLGPAAGMPVLEMLFPDIDLFIYFFQYLSKILYARPPLNPNYAAGFLFFSQPAGGAVALQAVDTFARWVM